MNASLRFVLPGLLLSFFLFAAEGMSADYYVIPFNVDPPIQVDANLGDWQNIPNVITMADAGHVTWHKEAKAKAWQGRQDLSAVVRLAWRYDGIYVAADVTDDVVQQPYGGRDVWKGDYVNLWLDLRPAFEPGRTVLGKGQFHIGMSPGNFNGTAGGEGIIPPRVFAFMPQNLPLENGRVASRRTAKGYVMEAFIPFADLEIADVRQNTLAAFEIAVSDSDDKPATQEMIMTSGTDAWQLSRARLIPMLFGDGNGEAEQPDKTIAVTKHLDFEPNQAHTLVIELDKLPDEMQAFLFLRGRSHFAKSAGYCNWALTVNVNGTQLEGDRLSNRPESMFMSNGHEISVIDAAGALTFTHEPEFGATDKDSHYRIEGQKVSEFEFNLDGLTRPGKNTIVLRNTSRAYKEKYPKIVVGDVELRVRPLRAGASFSRPAPIGPLPLIEPQGSFAKTYSGLDWNPARVRLIVNGESLEVKSRFSAPDGKWHDGTTRYFSQRRQVEAQDEWIIVKDTFKNLTDADLPLMYAYRCGLAGEGDVWLGGRKIGAKQARSSDPQNASAFGTTPKAGLGLLALNDEFRVHLEQNISDHAMEIGDFSFVLKPGGEYTAEWAIVPVESPDFWRFINTSRRMLDVNFTLKWMFAFAMKQAPVYDWSESTFKSFVENKSANFVVQSNYGVVTKEGKPARVTDWLAGPHDVYRDMQKRVRKIFPDGSVKTGIYYHCFLDTTVANAQRFAADRALDAQGTHIRYGTGRYAYMMLFIPTLENGFGAEMAKVLDKILDDIGADGVFWDEFSRSAVFYCYSHWDGCSGDIDRNTFRLTRKKGSLTLLSRDFREQQVKRILARGAPLVINGAPITRTLARHKFMAFTETGSIAHCSKMLLYSPVALGDHITEREPKHCHRVMLKALDHGCLYAWYGTGVFPRHKMLTEHMYPFTPIEIHEGYVIGRERIITNRSGAFGWGDNSEFTAYVYDRLGKATDRYPVKNVARNGKTYAEVRMPGGYAAAIVRANEAR